MFEVFTAIMDGRYEPVRSLRPDTPDRMVEAIDAALKPDREQRVASIRELSRMFFGRELSPSAWNLDDFTSPVDDDTSTAPTLDPGSEEATYLPPPTPAPVQRQAARETFPPDTGELPPSVDVRPRSLLPFAVGGAALFAGAAAAVVVAFGLASAPPPEPPPVVPTPVAAPVIPAPAAPTPQAPVAPAPEPVAPRPARPTPAPVVAPAPVAAPAPAVLPEPVPSPAPVAVAPTPVPAPEPVATPTTAQLTASGGTVRLHGAAGQFGPGEIPPGAYEVWLTAQGSTNQVLKLEVGAGQRVHLDCNGFLKTCVTR
ncbi:MAG: hypothetical protein H6736_09580 [Alphaproteobacteria bacterium]|nr:hypothetical protein [Alphaproteobacteria bacterium]